MARDTSSTPSLADIPDFVKKNVSQAMTVSDIATVMDGHASTSAWVPIGGTGARQQIFRLAGNLRVVFQFDGDDRLVAYGAYRSNEPSTEAQAEAFDGPLTLPG